MFFQPPVIFTKILIPFSRLDVRPLTNDDRNNALYLK